MSKHTKICVFHVSWIVSDGQSFNKNILNGHFYFNLFSLLVLYSLDYPLCLLPSYLNHAIIYFNEICTVIYLIYRLQVKEFINQNYCDA